MEQDECVATVIQVVQGCSLACTEQAPNVAIVPPAMLVNEAYTPVFPNDPSVIQYRQDGVNHEPSANE
jgi:hypothetical protein